MKYKIGDKVFIRENLIMNDIYGPYMYIINKSKGEQDIRGKWVILTGWRQKDVGYKCVGYSGISDAMIDHEITLIGEIPYYEIY